MDAWVYDIEGLKNFILLCFQHVTTKERVHFIIDETRNDRDKLILFIKNKWLIAFNNKYYDDVVVNYIVSKNRTYDDIYEFSQYVIKGEKEDFGNYHKKIKPYKYSYLYKSIDLLTMLFSKALRVKLKELQITMKYHNVQELPHKYYEIHTPKMKLDQIEYCWNDVDSTNVLFDLCIDDIKLRHKVYKDFGIECYSKDGVKVAVDYLSSEYCKRANIDLYEFSRNRYYDESEVIEVKNIIFPHIKFETEEFNRVLDYFRAFKIKPKVNYPEYKFFYNDTMYTLGGGGIHSENNPSIIAPNEDEIYYQSDVGGEYPNTLINNKLCPDQLIPEIFLPLFAEAYGGKKAAKLAGDKLSETFFKLVGNSFYGQLINEYGVFYSPRVAMSITINCQLQILMLVEQMELNGIHVIAANTDAIEVLIKKSQEDLYLDICSKWEKIVNLELEHDKIKKIIRRDVNNYIMIFTNDKVKTKGTFIPEVRLGKGYDKPVISKAVIAYFVDNIPFERFIREHDDIYDFCMMQKVGDNFECEWNGQPTQHINRYYVSKRGAYLYKVKDRNTNKESKQHLLKGFGVKLFNKYEEKSMQEYDIHYEYYISECRKLILQLEPIQMSLF